MSFNRFIRKKGYTIFLALAIGAFLLSLIGNVGVADTDKVAVLIGKRVEKRINLLETYIEKAAKADINEFLALEDLPQDMVIYRYVNDSLESWCNQFNIVNDDISCKIVFNRLTSFHNQTQSPLQEVESHYKYLNLGPKWYIIKQVNIGYSTKLIAGLEIKNDILENPNKAENGVNKKLKLSAKYSIHPISHTGGTAVTINEIPLFRIIFESGQAKLVQSNSVLRWFALLVFGISAFLYLYANRTFRTFFVVSIILFITFILSYHWGVQVQAVSQFFSPSIYADGKFLQSFGHLILFNAFIVSILLATCFMYLPVLKLARRHEKYKRLLYWLIFIFSIAAIIGVIILIHLGFKSLILNSDINLNIFYWNNRSIYGIISYISYAILFLTIPIQLVCIKPIIKKLFGVKINFNSIKASLVMALIATCYFGIATTYWEFKKEQDRIEIWGNRLALNRDLFIELQLRTIEEAIANDSFIFNLLVSESNISLIENRITELYINRSMSDYAVSVRVIKENDARGIGQFNQQIQFGNRIAKDSRFNYFEDRGVQVGYSGFFIFYHPQEGIIRMILELKSKQGHEDRGYYSILGRYFRTNNINIPPYYSYAKYKGGKLITFKGNYAYPTLTNQEMQNLLKNGSVIHLKKNNYHHFIQTIGQDEIILISRAKKTSLGLFAYYSFVFLALWCFIYITIVPKNRQRIFETNYYRSRINTLIIVSSFIILGSIAGVSISFVVQRNEVNLRNQMLNQVNTLLAHLDTEVKNIKSTDNLLTSEFAKNFEGIANITKTDITLYRPCGQVLLSTTPEIFERMIVGNRIDALAYNHIAKQHQRFYIHTNKFRNHEFYSIYAPVFNEEGKMIAILASPFTYNSTFLTAEAAMHTALIVNLFILLLIGTIFFSTHEVNAIFRPLANMAKKMSQADISNLEYIEYNRKDEISTIVDMYNKMVTAFEASTKQLAQAERDKAWSEMARQVAHEIKNPLTPIKLKIQQLIRLKENNHPDWTERFDDVSKVVLEHIDILSDTANEFSTFAQLYTEDPSVINLDEILKQQLMIFDNKTNIEVVYMGMENAYVLAPRPQLIRAIVNLLTNATQAIEIAQKEAIEEGREMKKGLILVCLRKSTKEGYYDIVIDDNGPGVNEEDLEKLFAPNFTTKSGGTGLGLAISRSIIEKCNGEISYKRAFVLKGASFTVTLSKHKD